MRWNDALTLAVRDLLRGRVRTALTMLGVALGSGLLVALAIRRQGRSYWPPHAVETVPQRPCEHARTVQPGGSNHDRVEVQLPGVSTGQDQAPNA